MPCDGSPPFMCEPEPVEDKGCCVIYVEARRKVKLSDYINGVRLKIGRTLACDKRAGIKLYGAFVRRGTCKVVLESPLFDIDGDDAVFRFDSAVGDLPCGRYLFEVRDRDCGGRVCAAIEINVTHDCIIACNAAFAPVVAKTPHTNSSPNFGSATTQPAPDPYLTGLITHMYDNILSFSANITRPLERSDTNIPLPAAALSALCPLVLCKSVQLLITDCVNEEIVEYSGCSGGLMHVVRGVGGTTPQKFPQGSEVKFIWTNDNVKNACAGC